jgi:putative FmdB family regulatory protein
MPTYDYECAACGHRFEKFQSISADPIKKCPDCGKAKAKRLIGTGAGVIFKGGGFYETDYRGEAYKADAKKDAGPSEKTDKADKTDKAKKDATAAKTGGKEGKSSGTKAKPAKADA